MSDINDWPPRHDFPQKNAYFNPVNIYDPSTDYGRRLSDKTFRNGVGPESSVDHLNSRTSGIIILAITTIILIGFIF